MEVMREKPGEITGSRAPKKNRTAVRPAALWTTACSVSTILQRKLSGVSVEGSRIDEAHINKLRYFSRGT